MARLYTLSCLALHPISLYLRIRIDSGALAKYTFKASRFAEKKTLLACIRPASCMHIFLF